MTDETPFTPAPALNRTSVALARGSLVKFAGLLISVLVLAAYSLIYLAGDLNQKEENESAFYIQKALHAFEKNLRARVRDNAFWGDAYKHLHSEVDIDWAFVRQNMGTSLYDDFGIQGIFVVDDRDRTVYSVIDGQLQTERARAWLKSAYAKLLSEARAGAETEAVGSVLVDIAGRPALAAAAAITPGTDPTVQADGRPASVLIFVDILDAAQLEALGADYGVQGLRTATAQARQQPSSLPLGEHGAAGYLRWEPEKPGERLLALGLPLLGITAALVCLMAWVLLRRTTAGAKALDASYHSLQRSQCALASSEARFRDVVEISSDWVWEVDSQWRFTYLSERFEAITGLDRSAWLGTPIDELLAPESGTVSQWLSTSTLRPDNNVHCRYVDAQGKARITRVSARGLGEQGFRGTATDVTGEVEARRQIEFLSQHDALTGLPNRTRLQAFLHSKLKAKPTRDRPLVMLSLDLDRFKPVNDLLGHGAGDRVLNEVARRLTDCVRQEDLVARVGGDEFVLIVCDLGSQENVQTLCQRLLESIEQPIEVEGQQTYISASIGVAIAPTDANEASELLRYADIALYEAKAGGRSTWRFYSGEMNARIIERRRLETDLRYAIQHGELRLHFQPRYCIADGRLVGAEALVRWQHPERGLVPPDTFIPIAEQTGLIIALSDWVIDTACQSAAQWPDAVFVSINLSPVEFKSGDLKQRIGAALVRSGIDPGRLELEVTESVMLDDADDALEAMQALKGLGVRLAMDDFGTGYSSLSYLRTFPFDGLKIDRSFLTRLGESEEDKAIILAIVGLGHALSLTVTAEGIETAEQLQVLNAVGCDEGQGYFLSRPLALEAFQALLQATPAAG